VDKVHAYMQPQIPNHLNNRTMNSEESESMKYNPEMSNSKI